MITAEVLHDAKNSNENSINLIIKRYEPLIISVAKGFNHPNLNLDEAIQEGRLAVLNAIRLFNPNKNITFATYARRAIKNRIINYITKAQKNSALQLIDNTPQAADGHPEEHFLAYEKLAIKLEEFKSNLSHLEAQILSLKLEGYSYTEIASLLQKTNKSVDNALTRIKTKILNQEN